MPTKTLLATLAVAGSILAGASFIPTNVSIECHGAEQYAIRATQTINTGTTTVTVNVGDPISFESYTFCTEPDGTKTLVPLTLQEYADLSAKQTKLPTTALSNVFVSPDTAF